MNTESSFQLGMGQILVRGGQLAANLTRAVEMIRRAAERQCRIVVLPECLDVGWTHPSARELAEPIPGPTSDRLAAAASQQQIYVVAGLTERSGQRIYNTAILIDVIGKPFSITHARRFAMQVRTDSKDGTPVASPSNTVQAFQTQTQGCLEPWIQQLQEDPDCLAEIEQQIDQHYRQGGGELVASLLAQVTEDPQMNEHVQQVRQNAAIALRAPERRTIEIRLLCGLLLWITTWYCAPRRTKATDPSEQRKMASGKRELARTLPNSKRGQPQRSWSATGQHPAPGWISRTEWSRRALPRTAALGSCPNDRADRAAEVPKE